MANIENYLKKRNISEEEAIARLKSLERNSPNITRSLNYDFSGQRIKVGVVGDTHFGNRWTDKKFLNAVFQEFKKQKVDTIWHLGDFTDGPWSRHHNVLEQYSHGIENQVQDFVDDFPNIGVDVYSIQGNHDDWYKRNGSGEVGKLIAAQRSDIKYLGMDEARIQMGKIEVMLSHPEDGSAYAYSYKPQKQLEAMFQMEEKMPNILLIGHYHKLFTMNRGGVNIILTGTTCRQTPWMRGKKIAADIGAYILDVYKHRDGNLSKLTTTLLPYYGDKHSPCVK